MRPFGLVAIALVVAVGARIDAQGGPGWDLKVPERVELAAGSTGTLPITITVERGQTISKDGGMIVDLAPEPGVSIKRRRLGRGDTVDPDDETPRFAVPLRADATGDFSLKVHVRFWLCGSKVCRPIDARRTVTVSVAVPPPPPPPVVDAGVGDAPPKKH